MVKIRVSGWLRPSDVRDGDIVVIVDEGRNRSEEETPFGRPVFEIGVRVPSGEVKALTMNRTTQRRCVDAWGDETRNWIGKRLKMEIREQNVRGQMKKVLYGIPIKEELELPKVAPSEGETVTLTLTKEEAEKLKALLGKK